MSALPDFDWKGRRNPKPEDGFGYLPPPKVPDVWRACMEFQRKMQNELMASFRLPPDLVRSPKGEDQ